MRRLVLSLLAIIAPLGVTSSAMAHPRAVPAVRAGSAVQVSAEGGVYDALVRRLG